MRPRIPSLAAFALATLTAVAVSLAAAPLLAHEPPFTGGFDRDRCTFTTTGNNPYFPLWPGYALTLEGEEEDDGETIEVQAITTVTTDTELVDGVVTRVVEERESEDGELVEVSRNWFAFCRETGDIWYFGEEVDDYEDGMIVGHGGGWRAGVDGAKPGIIMPGTLFIGARFQQEDAPGVAEDRGEVIALGLEVDVPAGSFENVARIDDTNPLDSTPSADVKLYARGVGIIADEELELTDIDLPVCVPDATTHCLNNGRFRVTVDWESATASGAGNAILGSADSGEFWFFQPDNTELLVKVLNACDLAGFNNYWVFAGGLTDVELRITVTDTQSLQTREYTNELGTPFAPVQDTSAFATCP